MSDFSDIDLGEQERFLKQAEYLVSRGYTYRLSVEEVAEKLWEAKRESE